MRKRGTAIAQTCERIGGVSEEQTRTGVLEDVGRKVGCLRRIDRHDDAAGEKRREVANDPIDAVVRDECDAIARRQAGVADRTGNVLDSLEQMPARRRSPFPRDALDERLVARLSQRFPN